MDCIAERTAFGQLFDASRSGRYSREVPIGMSQSLRGWPSLSLSDWQPTRDTLQLWTQIIGKVRLANEPIAAQWWNVPLYLTARGLTTSPMPHPAGDTFQIDFDFQNHRLDVATVSGGVGSIALASMPIADFYASVMGLLDDVGVGTPIWPVPVEIADAIPFADDDVHGAYDPEQAHRFWLALVEMERIFKVFRSEFVGKVSPVHLFWGGLDLAVTRFSGRAAPPHPGGAPNCGPHVMLEAYSQEVSSAGYWPGGDDQGLFYSYAYPEPDGFRAARVRPQGTRYDDDLGEFVLPYTTVRNARDPGGVLLQFLHSTYDAAATCGSWDREALERTSRSSADHVDG